MSVQAGTWNLDEEPATKGMVAKIGSHVAEYGPDGESISVDGPVAMLYRPFHTTADSRHESQPYRLNNGTLITWDGRLDNRIELAAELELDRPLATIDVAIIGAAFEEWGTECFQRLIGDWALCIWNPEKKELILARDYIGARQLFYYVRRNNVVWSSHLVSLALFGDQLTVCDEYVAGYLAFPRQRLWSFMIRNPSFTGTGRVTGSTESAIEKTRNIRSTSGISFDNRFAGDCVRTRRCWRH
jgi:asparagine synthase (glutamine-hydrolysing)